MFAALGFAAGGGLKTISFPAGKTTAWKAPGSTSRIESMSGYGARGTDDGSYQYYNNKYQTGLHRRDGGQGSVTGPGPAVSGYDMVYELDNVQRFGNPPADYCDAVVFYTTEQSSTYDFSQKCYSYPQTTVNVPQTTGASATGVGKTFPGSAGNKPQTTTTFNQVAVTPNTTYNIVVPDGGNLTITYFE